MALFVQIDHFRKTDQKPTVKNHLFSISWFRSFNRTSFQQQLKHWVLGMFKKLERLQSYILSTTTETIGQALNSSRSPSFNRTSFQQQLKQNVLYRLRDSLRLQSYILSTTTETFNVRAEFAAELSFNRTSFQQQLKPLLRCLCRP